MLAPPLTASPPDAAAPASAPSARHGAAGLAGGYTVDELAARFGSLPARRILTTPAPGTATREDADRLRAAGVACELVEGTLVEKAVSFATSTIAIRLAWLLTTFAEDHDLGWVGGSDGYVDLYGGTLQRAPDVSLVLDGQYPGGLPRRGWIAAAPALCVEVFSPTNTLAEMRRKRTEYFENGCRCVWVVFGEEAPAGRANTAEVYLPGDADAPGGGADEPARVVRDGETLTGDPVLPGFEAPLAKCLRRQGRG